MARPLIMNRHKIFTCLICVNSEHPLFINVNCAMHAMRLKVDEKEFLTTNKFDLLQRDSLSVAF